MPLQIVQVQSEQDCQGSDVEIMEVSNDRVFTVDGSRIKVWNANNLTLVDDFDLNKGGMYTILIKDNHLYASTVDDTISIWDLEKKTIIDELILHENSVNVLRQYQDLLYSADANGLVCCWRDKKMVKSFEICEEIWDMSVSEDRLYTVRDRGLLIQNNNKATLQVIDGRGPMCRVAGKICLLTTNGMNIDIYHDKDNYAFIQTIQGGDRMINALSCSSDGKHLYSGGWDNAIQSWDLTTYEHASKVQLEQAVNCIRVSGGDIYVGGNNGLLVKLNDI